MASAHTNVISNTHIAFLTSPDLYELLVFSVNNVENFLGRAVQRFEDDEVLFRFINLDDINDFMVMNYLEREHLLTDFAIKLFELNDDLSFMYFH